MRQQGCTRALLDLEKPVITFEGASVNVDEPHGRPGWRNVLRPRFLLHPAHKSSPAGKVNPETSLYRHNRRTLPGEDLTFSIKAEDKSDIRCTMSAGINAGDGSMNVSSTNA